MSDPTIRWIRVRDMSSGWVVINMDAISHIRSFAPNGVSMRMISGSLILMTRKEADRVLTKLLPHGIRP